MSAEDRRWVGTPEERQHVRDALARELMLRVMLHDLRGSLTAVRGWVELLGMDGRSVPGGLTRSVEGFQRVVERYGDVSWPGRARPGQPGILGLVARTLGCETSGLPGPGPIDSLRLIAALELAQPQKVSLVAADLEGVSVEILHLEGLDDHALSLGITPHHDQILARLEAPDDVLGVCLLREVARGGQGEVRSRAPGTFELVCRV